MNAHPAGSAAVLPTAWKLLRLRWRITWNTFRRTRLVSRIFTIIGLLTLAALAGFIFWASWQMTDFLHSPELLAFVGDLDPFIKTFPVLILTGFFVGILLTSFGVLLQALYLSRDMDFLLAAPVPIRAVFISKLLQAILPNFGLSALFGLPILYGLGAAGGYNLLYYLLTPLMMVALSLAAAGGAGVLVMLVVRVFPARRVAEVLGFLTAIFSIICSQSGNLMNANSDNVDISSQQVSSLLRLVERFNAPWFPLNWPGRGLVSLGENNWLPGIGLTLLSLGLAAALFWVSLQTAESWYYTGWATVQVVPHKKRAPAAGRSMETPARLNSLRALVRRLVTAPVYAIVWKDFLMLRRDLRHLSQLITPLIFGVIYGFMFLSSGGQVPEGQGEAPEWFMESFRTLLVYGNVGISLFVGWMLVMRLGGMGFSAEGKNYWMLKAAPLSSRYLLTAKFLVSYLPSLLLTALFLVAFSLIQKTAWGVTLYSLFVLAWCLAGMNGIQLAFGVVGANFNWEDPRRINAGSMGCLGSIVTPIYLLFDLAFFFLPPFLAEMFRFPGLYGYLVGAVLGIGFSVLCTWLPPRLVARRVEHLGE
jgi:ABC-2 type transport system permease protein